MKANAVLPIILAVVITAVVVGGIAYLFMAQEKSIQSNGQIVQFNCEQSGGVYSAGSCDCSGVDGEFSAYEESSGYCIAADGTPGGELGETARKLLEAKMGADERILISPSNYNRYNKLDSTKVFFNHDEPNEYSVYENIKDGIAISLPYNKSWGNNEYRINPYDEILDKDGNVMSLEYGPISVFEGGGWVRAYQISFTEAKTADEVISEIIESGQYTKKPEIVRTSQFEVVKYGDSGLCEYPYMIVIGEKHNYKFGFTCGSLSDESFKFLEDMIDRMSFR